jgi:hypothetical protein
MTKKRSLGSATASRIADDALVRKAQRETGTYAEPLGSLEIEVLRRFKNPNYRPDYAGLGLLAYTRASNEARTFQSLNRKGYLAVGNDGRLKLGPTSRWFNEIPKVP